MYVQLIFPQYSDVSHLVELVLVLFALELAIYDH